MRIRQSHSYYRIVTACLLWSAILPVAARGQNSNGLEGHWEGSIQVPGTELKFNLDFHPKGDGWEGDLSIPIQRIQDFALADITLADGTVGFALPNQPGIAGSPTFKGRLSEDGKRITGDFTQGGQTLPFSAERGLKRAADAIAALEGFGDSVNQALKDWNIPGLAIGIVLDDEVIYARGFGKRDLESDKPVTTQTIFAIGSSTKAFTTFVMGTLVDEGKFSWDRPVMEYIPNFRLHDDFATTHLTPRDMVTHRCGLPRHDLAWYNNNSLTRKEMVERLRYYQPSKELRESFQYNNMMFLTSGYLVELITGRTWEDVVRDRVFKPLGMARSNFSVDDSQKDADFAFPYEENDDVVKRMNFRNIDQVGPAGSINSCVDDMTNWLRVQLAEGEFNGQPIIGAATLKEIHAPQVTLGTIPEQPELAPASYGMGWFVQPYRGHLCLHHGGAIDGFIALVSLFPNDGLGVVAFSNFNGSPLPTLMTRHAVDRILGLPDKDWNGEALTKYHEGKKVQKEAEKKKDTLRVPDTKPAHPLEAYAGDYENTGYGLLKVEVQGERLVLTFNGITTPFEHWHYEVFNGLENPEDKTFEDLRVQFLTNMKGDVDRVALPLEPAVDEIVFRKKPDARMSDPTYLARFLGVYLFATVEVTVSLQGNTLTLSVPGQPLYELIPDRNDEFNFKDISGFSVRFKTGDDGKIAALFNQPNGVFELKRKE